MPFFNSVIKHYALIWQLSKREVLGRYKGSFLGLLWSFLYPLVMLMVYTLFFTMVFKSRWPGMHLEDKSAFALALFVGLIFYNFFAEMLNRAPSLVTQNVSYVKKVVFPLEILPCVSAGAALFHLIASIVVFLIFSLIFNGHIPWTIFLFPLVLLPLLLLCLGLAWFLAALGVYLRDVAQTVGIITTIMMYLSPVFFPASNLPAPYSHWLSYNPLTFILEQARDVMLWGKMPDWIGLGEYILITYIIAYLALCGFERMKKGFADVL